MVQESHIAANVPSTSDFERLLDRDLNAYFEARRTTPGPLAVTHESLREGPTQSGVATPKYYLWVVATVDGKPWREGAVRVAAIAGEKFTVTDFLSREELTEHPEHAPKVFPRPVVDHIVTRMKQ